MATSLGLGAVSIGAFHDARLHCILGLDPGEEPLALIAVKFAG
jgi:nitroreductase